LDHLVKVRAAFEQGLIPQKIYDSIKERFSLVLAGIERVEKASGTKYPVSYVEPSALLTTSPDMTFGYGILYARTLPVFFDEKFQVVIQISAPLVAFGLKGTIHAILAHEFLHYLELVRKASRMELLSDEVSANLFENVYADSTRLFEARAVFDYKLDDKTEKLWISKQLPATNLTLDTNTVKLSAESLAKVSWDPVLLAKIKEYEERELKLRKKKIY
jgi:hypothetical protein